MRWRRRILLSGIDVAANAAMTLLLACARVPHSEILLWFAVVPAIGALQALRRLGRILRDRAFLSRPRHWSASLQDLVP